MTDEEQEFMQLAERALRSHGKDLILSDTQSVFRRRCRIKVDDDYAVEIESARSCLSVRTIFRDDGDYHVVFECNRITGRVDTCKLPAILHLIPILQKKLVLELLGGE